MQCTPVISVSSVTAKYGEADPSGRVGGSSRRGSRYIGHRCGQTFLSPGRNCAADVVDVLDIRCLRHGRRDSVFVTKGPEEIEASSESLEACFPLAPRPLTNF